VPIASVLLNRLHSAGLMPPRPACLTHGDLWANNILATAQQVRAILKLFRR
jgi:aminoglycoside phosphotransferase (APT) family kinase protein